MGQRIPVIASRRNSVQAPPMGPLSCVFTDIVDSTALWEFNVLEMWEALREHNRLIRPLIDNFRGYEIKTTGDGFHLAFQNAIDALKFCLSVQIAICTHNWPQEILDSYYEQAKQARQAEQVGQAEQVRQARRNVAHECLAVRTGAHFGMPDFAEMNPTSQRVDYYGPMVNRSARVAHLAGPGEVAVSDDLIREIWRLQTEDAVDTTGEMTDATRTRILQKVAPSRLFKLDFMRFVELKGVKEEA
ncbi:adenylyl cyclase [Stipitochalara longipes BDJ]|nr:adenylyl cyclase [Stipitochalara longipes BDJ]